jgi:hypothetical protein
MGDRVSWTSLVYGPGQRLAAARHVGAGARSLGAKALKLYVGSTRDIAVLAPPVTLAQVSSGLWRFFRPFRELLFSRPPKIFSRGLSEYFWLKSPGIAR